MAITYARVQSKTADADPGAVTLDATPVEGNLLVAHATDRSGGDAANFAISGTGWTKQVAETTLQGDSNARRTHVVWWKVAGASEPKLISVDDGTANTKRVLAEEYEAGATATWSFEASVPANTGTGSTSPLASGDTASTSGTQLLVGSGIWRNGTGDPGSVAFSGLGTVVTALGGSNGRTAASAFAQSTATGTKSTSLSWTGAGHEANVALLVFSATENGGITGTLAVTEAADVLAASGTHTPPPISGSLAETEAADTLAASGTHVPPGVTGTVSVTEEADTLAAAGTVTVPAFTGTLAVTEQPDTLAASGAVTTTGIVGSLAVTEAPDVLAAAGASVPPPITGTLAVTEAGDVLAAAGTAGPLHEIFAGQATGVAAPRVASGTAAPRTTTGTAQTRTSEGG